MMTFTGLVPSAETRSTSGWVMISIVLGYLVAFNLTVIVYQSLKTSKRNLILRVIKARKK